MASDGFKGKGSPDDTIVGRVKEPKKLPTIIDSSPQWAPYKFSPFGGDGERSPTSEAIKAVAIEHGIKEPEASRLVRLMGRDPHNPEFATLTAQQKASLEAARVGYDPWRIAPVSVETGEPLPMPGKPEETVVIASTREQQIKRVEIQEAAIKLLEGKGLLGKEGDIKLKAYTFADMDKKVKQALYDVGLTGKQVKEGIAFVKRARRVKKPRVVIPPEMKVDIGKRPPVIPTGVPDGPPMPIKVKHPAYLKGRKAFRELQVATKKPTLENIQGIIDEWKNAQAWWVMYEDLHPAKIKAGFKREFEGTAGKEYMSQLEAYNSQVIEYNGEIAKLNKVAEGLEKEGAALGIDKVDKYNDEMARLNALTLSWERQAAGINLENEAAVRLHNEKLANIKRDYAKLEAQTGAINTALQGVNAFNTKVADFNTSLANIKEPGEAPPEPLKTVGNIAAAIFEGLKSEYKNAARKELTLKEKVRNVSLLTAELVVPGVWAFGPYTGRTIKDMSKGAIAFNVALDLFVLIPVVRIVGGLVKGALRATAKGAIKQALSAEAKLVKDAVLAMRNAYGKGAANALKKVSQLQATYIKRLAKLESLKVKGKPTTSQLRATIKTENKLRIASKNFVDEVRNAQTRLGEKGVVGAGFDSPEIARAFYSMPEELIRHTKGALQAITKPKVKKSIKQLKADVVKAEAALKAAKAKTTWDATQWIDLVDDLMMKQSRLSLRQSGGIAKIHQELIRTQQQLGRVKARMKAPGVKLTTKQRRELKLSELNLERQLLDLTQQMRSGLKSMEVEWGRGGMMVGGGSGAMTATMIRPKVMPTTLTGGAVAAPTTATMTAFQAAARTAIEAAVVRAVGRPIPEAVEVIKGLTDVEIIRAVEAETIKAVKLAEKLAQKPTTKVGLAAKQALKVNIAERVRIELERAIKVAPSAKIRSAIEAKILPITEAAVKVGLEMPRPIKPIVPKPKLIPRIPPAKADKKNRKRISASKGAIAWRHGELRGKDVFHVGLYPYTRQSDYLTVVGKKPTGATIVKGPGSARQSIKLLYGKAPPRAVRGDIGFFDFHITPTGPKRVDIDFKPDPKLETTGDITIGRRTPPITERPVGLRRGKSPRITPKTPRLRR